MPAIARTLDAGGVVVLEQWCPAQAVRRLREDAERLYESGAYKEPDRDVLLRRGAAFDRSVLRESQFSDWSLGDGTSRREFGAELARLKLALAEALDRPSLVSAEAHRDEASYTRFGPGAALRKHVDEHHEDLKGRDGWRETSRRSISWLCYLNEQWDADAFGGQLRTYERSAGSAGHVGAHDGDLAVGWLAATPADPVDRPVFLDSQVRGNNFGGGGNCQLYVLAPTTREQIVVSRTFFASPVMFLKGAVKDLVLTDALDARRRYAPIEDVTTPAVVAARRLVFGPEDGGYDVGSDVAPRDIPPAAGTLVLFDSVTVPHEVLETKLRPRFAVSGWFHENQQPHFL